MTKAALVAEVTKTKGLGITKKQAELAINAVFNGIAGAIKKDKRFSYPGFGTWTVRTRKGRKGRNPRTGAPITIKPSKTVGFKPAPKLKAAL